MRRRISIIILSFIGIYCSAQNNYIKEDFSNGIPANFTLIDNDRNTPSNDVMYAGFSKGVAWVAYDIENNGNMVAASTSWYNPSGQAEDWMILPSITVEDDCILTWQAKAFDSKYSDGYSVYVSDKGNQTNDFDTTTPIFSINSESSEWCEHKLSLEEYIGKDIYIAFVNNSTDCSMLLIDDIFVGTPLAVDFTLTSTPQVEPYTPVTISISVFTELEETITSIKAGYTYNGKEISAEYDNLSITAGNRHIIELPETITPGKNEVIPIEIWVEYNGKRVNKKFNITGFSRRILVEDLTATWCAYCVSAIVALEELGKKYDDDFISIAIHCNDIMAISNYELHYTGLPTVWVNRSYSTSTLPHELYDYIETRTNDIAEVGVIAQASIINDKIFVNTQTYFAQNYDKHQFRLTYVLIENDVHVPDNEAYYQKNAYAGGSMGEMGGFENKPEIIPPTEMYFQEVARVIEPSLDGLIGSIPETITAGIGYEYQHTFDLPDNVLHKENLQLVVIVNSVGTRKAYNAVKIPLNSGTDNTDTIKSDNEKYEIARYNIMGQRIDYPQTGINIIKYSDGSVKKIIIK